MLGEHFDAWWPLAADRFVYAALRDGAVVGQSSFYDVEGFAAFLGKRKPNWNAPE